MQQAHNNGPEDHPSTIIVNGRPRKWEQEEIFFEDLAQLAFPNAPPNPNRIFTVTYRKGAEQGSLVAGKSLTIKPGTIFNVIQTDKS